MDTECNWLTLLPEVILGAEVDPAGAGDDSGDPDGDSDDDEGDGDGAAGGDSGDSSGGESHSDSGDAATKGLKSALAAERKAAKDATKRANALQKEKDERELATKSEVEQANTKLEQAQERANKLSAGLLKRDLDAAIRKAASNFIDADDAIAGVDRSKLVFTQDEDDPTDIEIDTKTVEKLVKELATKKPHFLKPEGTDDGQPTGSGFGGTGNRSKDKKTQEELLKEKYPSLR